MVYKIRASFVGLASLSRGAKNTVSTKFNRNEKSEKTSDAKSGHNTNGSRRDEKKASQKIVINDPERAKRHESKNRSRKDDVDGDKKDRSESRKKSDREVVILGNKESKNKSVLGELIAVNGDKKQRSVSSNKSSVAGRDDVNSKKRSIQDGKDNNKQVQENKRSRKDGGKESSKNDRENIEKKSASKERSKKDPNIFEHKSKSKDRSMKDSNNVENRSKSRERSRSRGPASGEKKIKFFRPFLDEDDDYEKKKERLKSRERSDKSVALSSHGKNKAENKNKPKERSNAKDDKKAKDTKNKNTTKKSVDTVKLRRRTKIVEPEETSSAVQTRTGNDGVLMEIQLTELDKHLHNIRTILLNSNATPIQNHDETGFTCGFCVAQFITAADLKIHTLDDHDEDYIERFMVGAHMYSYVVKLDITSLRCIMCTRKIFTLENLIEHLESKHNKMFHKDIKNHILPFKFQSDVFTCVICDRKFDRFKHMQHHMSAHYKNYLCDECNSPFINKATLRTHLKRHTDAVYTCDFCGKNFDTKIKCTVHENYVHMRGHSRNRCTYCHEFFVRYVLKIRHMVEVHGHKQRTVKCNSCSKTFQTKEKYTKHNKRYHLLERNYKCDLCEGRFFDSYDLKRHKRTVHQVSKGFKCPTCDKAFTRHDNMLEHLRHHNQEYRNITCELCGLNFATMGRFKRHMSSAHKDRKNASAKTTGTNKTNK